MLRILALFALLFAVKAQLEGSHGMEQVFKQVDTDNDNAVSLAEFQQFASKLDIDNNGSVTKAEFVQASESAVTGSHNQGSTRQTAEAIFALIDPGSGAIAVDQLVKLFNLFDADDSTI